MKNKSLFFLFLFFLSFFLKLSAQEIEIKSSKLQYDDMNKVTIFEGDVSSYDEKGNKIFSEYAQYNKIKEIINTKGNTKIVTSGGYEVFSSDVIFDNKKNTIHSNNKTKIIDKDGNIILTEMFNYSILKNIFFSKGKIKISDINNNNYNFAEIYIDENKKKIIGSDIKAFLNQTDMLAHPENEPRFFANTMSFSDNKNTFEKGVFTYCKIREDDKCPPWTLKSKKITHDLTKKTIYYDDVVLKIYDFPIFFSPKFSHPDPTVDRRSGLLAPSLSNSTTLSSGVAIPYFLNIAKDKDLTFTPKFFLKENPLMLAEYRQDFSDSFITFDVGYTKGYKKKNIKKSDGGRAHFFSNFYKNILDDGEKSSSLEINIEKVSNDTYFKVYDINTTLVQKEKSILENKVEYVYQDNDFFLGLAPAAFEDTNKLGHLRHEYLLPLTIEKNIMYSDKYGSLNFDSKLKLRNYDTNKKINLLVNDFKWKSKKWLNSIGVESYFESLLKNVNYDAHKTGEFKNDENNHELHSALGYFAKLNLFKKDFIDKNLHSLTPKFLLRYAPGHMRKAGTEGNKLNYGNLFNLNKLNQVDILEPGLSTSVGFEYKKNKLNDNNIIGKEMLTFSMGQVISQKENMDIPSSSSLDQRFSDIVGTGTYRINAKSNLNYNFSIDQGYKNFNYNEIGADFGLNKAKFNINYLQEKNHVGNQEYLKTGFEVGLSKSSEVTFNTKRNLLTSSAEFYNLSYNYINDCLKAGIAYRREFYTDRDIEPVDKLMFTISIVPFSTINTPGFK
jgi:LPS-assembly protein